MAEYLKLAKKKNPPKKTNAQKTFGPSAPKAPKICENGFARGISVV